MTADKQLPAETGAPGQPEIGDDRMPDRLAGAAVVAPAEEAEMWRDRALRLQAEMENYRKRQARRAEARIEEERDRLLAAFISIADDLERALRAGSANVAELRHGVALTHHALLRLLEHEDVRPIDPEGQDFDPQWHEAVGRIAHEQAGVPPGTVVEVVQQGYRLEDRVLRPARVIVAT